MITIDNNTYDVELVYIVKNKDYGKFRYNVRLTQAL